MASKNSSSSSSTASPKSYGDFARRAFEPASRFNEVVVSNVERIARFQYEVTGELMQLGLDQLNATVSAKDLPTLFALQREIATRYFEKASQRQQALADLASESQASLAKWFEDTTAFAGAKAA